MRHFVSHGRGAESPEAKARWFQSLTLAERMEYLCAVTEMALSRDPGIDDRKDPPAIKGRFQILRRPQE